MGKAGKVAQLRRAGRQGRNGFAKGETLAETLAEQSRLSRTSCRFRLSDLGSQIGRLLEPPAPAGALLSSDDCGLSVERTAKLHPLWQVHVRLLSVGGRACGS
jgi:hypothetical protein